jgi:hypothetical protein
MPKSTSGNVVIVVCTRDARQDSDVGSVGDEQRAGERDDRVVFEQS